MQVIIPILASLSTEAWRPKNPITDQGGWSTVSVVGQQINVEVGSTPQAAAKSSRASDAQGPPCWMHPDPGFKASRPDSLPIVGYGSTEKAGDHPVAGQGQWYHWDCSDEASLLDLARQGKLAEFWVPSSDPSSPKALGQKAASMIQLPAPQMNMNPQAGMPQWVNLPLFLWTDQASWRSLSATAAVPGVQVTAVAEPLDLSRDMGDGTTVTCHGPGTPFANSLPAPAVSPDCGHVYQRASAAEPDSRFPVRLTERRRVTWSGGGQSGSLPDMTATSTTSVRVLES